jgi:hypothetical protein
MANDFEDARIQSEIFRSATAGNNESVIVSGLGALKSGVQRKIVATLFGVGLVAFEIVNGGANGFTGFLAGTDGVHVVANHKQGLERDHHFVVFNVIANEHENVFVGHESLLEESKDSRRAMN